MSDVDEFIERTYWNQWKDQAVLERVIARCGVGNSDPIGIDVKAIASEVGLDYDHAYASVRRLVAGGYVELAARAESSARGNFVKVIRGWFDSCAFDGIEP